MSVRYTEDLLTTGAPITAATQVLTDNRTGFTVGAGIEFGLVENLSAKVEYDFYDFGRITPVSGPKFGQRRDPEDLNELTGRTAARELSSGPGGEWYAPKARARNLSVRN